MNPLLLLVTTATAAGPGSAPLETPPAAPLAEAPPAAPMPDVRPRSEAPPAKPTPPPSTPAVDPDEPVVRAHSGDYGMVFRFGGLGTLFATGDSRATDISSSSASNVLLTQAGIKKVFDETWMMPIYFGAGMRRIARDDVGGVSRDAQTDWGFDVGIGLEYHFRIWRRISPFVGATLGLAYSNPSDDDNARFGVGIAPNIGVEYYVFDHVSLQALYMLNLQVERQFAGQTATTLSTQAGGALNLTFYF